MPREYKLYLEDILTGLERVKEYTSGLDFQSFASNSLIVDAVLRNLEIIGEAAKQIPVEFRRHYPDMEWRKITGIRDILAHAYFSISTEIIWDIVQNKLPALGNVVQSLLKDGK